MMMQNVVAAALLFAGRMGGVLHLFVVMMLIFQFLQLRARERGLTSKEGN